ncbi:hypothetical protein PUN28_008424 [Cardiocondyla obscurior]|uniref:Uncharacterized protein n=1 Tax=Cardiocondyla obscurior TaxID=286306 RepID=A0AAW2G2N2_9HYME
MPRRRGVKQQRVKSNAHQRVNTLSVFNCRFLPRLHTSPSRTIGTKIQRVLSVDYQFHISSLINILKYIKF